jgi:hypothetical protein
MPPAAFRGLTMPRHKQRAPDDVANLLKDLLITQLSVAGVPQLTIRTIVGCEIGRVNRIAKHINAVKKREPA